jgi:hypothetical protein
VDENGNPVTNAQIEEIGHTWRHERLSAQSNAVGRFTLASRIPSFPRQLIARDDAGGRLGSASCAFSESAEPLRIVVRKAREIVASVTDGQGRPVPNAKVAAVRSRSEGTVSETRTDARGKATLRVPAGTPLESVFAVKEGVGFDYLNLMPPRRPRARRQPAAPEATQPVNSVSLVLDGAQRVRAHVVDENDAPLAGVLVRATQIGRPGKGGPIQLSGIRELEVTSDALGIAEFRALPLKRGGGLNLVCVAPGSLSGALPLLDRASEVRDVQLIAHPSADLRVLVTLIDGRPAPGAKITSTYRYASGIGFGNSVAFGDEEGLWQFHGFQQDAVGIVSAEVGHFASPIARFDAQKGQPIPLIHLIVRPACRVHGSVTYGNERRPVANEWITLQQRGERVADRVPPQNSHDGSEMVISRSSKTDRQGRFEFFAAPGRYSILDSIPVFRQIIGNDMTPTGVSVEEGAKEFEITDQAEIEVDFERARPPAVDFDGRVVLESDRSRGVADVIIAASPVDARMVESLGPGLRSSADGTFHTQRRPCEMLVEAQTADGSSCGLVRVFAGEKNVIIPVAAGTAARGVLVDATTGQPVRNQRIICGIRLEFSGRGFTLAFRQISRTNLQGEFELWNLPRGWKFELYAVVSVRGAPTSRYERLGEFTTDKTTAIDLGKVKLSAPAGAAAKKHVDEE